jgi:hypothetical protein
MEAKSVPLQCQHMPLFQFLIHQESTDLQLTFATVEQMELFPITSNFCALAGFLPHLIAPEQSSPFVVSTSIMN